MAATSCLVSGRSGGEVGGWRMRTPCYAVDDATLLAACSQHAFSGRGPGGQHRNRHAAGIRLVHRASGCEAVSIDHRSREANRRTALRRLRLRLALCERGEGPRELIAPFIAKRRLAIGPTAANYPTVVGVLLDRLHHHDGEVRAAAESLGITSSQFVRQLVADKQVRRVADDMRAGFGRPPLSG